LLRFHGNNGYANAPQCKVVNTLRTLSIFFNAELVCKIHATLHVSHVALQKLTSESPLKCSHPKVIKIWHHAALQTQNEPKYSVPSLCCVLPTIQFPSSYLLHFRKLYPVYSLPLPERKKTYYLGTMTGVNVSLSPAVIIIIIIINIKDWTF